MDTEVAVPTCPDCDQVICPGCVAHTALERLRTEHFDVPDIAGFDLTNIKRVLTDAGAFEDVRVAKLAATLTMLSRGRWECCAKHSVQESRGWRAYEASATASLKRLAKLWALTMPVLERAVGSGLAAVTLRAFDAFIKAGFIEARIEALTSSGVDHG